MDEGYPYKITEALRGISGATLMAECGRIMALGLGFYQSSFINSNTQIPFAIPSIKKLTWRPPMMRASASLAVEEEEKAATKTTPRLKVEYSEKIIPVLKEEFKYTNLLQVPKVEKVVVNCGIGEAAQNAKSLEAAIRDLSLLTGQRPVKTRAKKAIAGFKLKEGVPVGLAVTLRGNIMYNFLDRVINLGLPRTRDFQGVNPNSFDGQGNYNIGVREQSVFPEIQSDSIANTRGMDICITTTAKTDSEAQKLLALMGMPFREGVAPVVLRKKKRRVNPKDFKGKYRR